MDSFVYEWYDQQTGKRYIGVHKGTPDDGYICSSKLMLEQYDQRKEDFSRIIIDSGSFQEMIELETSMLKAVDARANTYYYNAHNGDGKFICKGHSNKTRLKMSQNNARNSPWLGKKLSDEHKQKIQISLFGNQRAKGNKLSDETRQKMSIARKGQKRTEKTKMLMRKPKSKTHIENIRKASIGRKLSDEAKKKISLANKGKIPWNKGMSNG